jgi:Transposase DDE domain group 1
LVLRSIKHPREKGTSKVKRTNARPSLSVTADGKGVAAHAGTRLLAEMADFVGLTSALSDALAPTMRRSRRHDPGRVLLDVALTLADGGDCLSDLSVLRDQPALFGAVASTPTASRVVDSVDAVVLAAMRAARAKARERAWLAGLSPVRSTGPLILDFDATLVEAHSDKSGAGPNYKGGYGFSPLACFCDATNEALAILLRSGNRAPHNADDHIEVLNLALAQLPVAPLGLDPEHGVAMLVRTDSAGASHQFVDALVERGIEFSIGFEMREAVRLAILALPKKAWTEAITADCEIREGAEVAELTNLDLSLWPVGTRAIVRREEPHDGAQFNLFDPAGWRHQVFITNSSDPDIAYLEARHRGHARVEDRIRCAKDTGLRNLPFGDFANNACWVELICLAQDLIAFTQGLVLEGDMAKAEPKRLRYALLHTAGRLSTTSRRTTLALQREWPWASTLAAAFARLRSLPLTT